MKQPVKPLGELITEDPSAAVTKLKRLFASHGHDVNEVAATLGVDRVTVFRWLGKLRNAGYPDPRGGKRSYRMGRPPKCQ